MQRSRDVHLLGHFCMADYLHADAITIVADETGWPTESWGLPSCIGDVLTMCAHLCITTHCKICAEGRD